MRNAPTTLDELKTQIDEIWGNLPVPLAAMAKSILDYIDTERPDLFGYGKVAEIAGEEELSGHSLTAVTILSNFPVFDPVFLFRDEDGTDHEVKFVYEQKFEGAPFHHPLTGEVVEDATSRIYPMFRPRPDFFPAKAPTP